MALVPLGRWYGPSPATLGPDSGNARTPGKQRLGKVLSPLAPGRHAEDDGSHALGAEKAVPGARLDVDDGARLDIDHVVVQFHLALALQNVVHLGTLAVIVPHRV